MNNELIFELKLTNLECNTLLSVLNTAMHANFSDTDECLCIKDVEFFNGAYHMLMYALPANAAHNEFVDGYVQLLLTYETFNKFIQLLNCLTGTFIDDYSPIKGKLNSVAISDARDIIYRLAINSPTIITIRSLY